MSLNPVDLLRKHPREEDELPRAPLAGTKSQSVQRLQVGLFGLGAMVLLVGLANIIMTNAQKNQAQVVAEAAPSAAAQSAEAPASDPLADAGVVPDLPAEPEAGTSGAPAAGNAP
jgi:hypothetical protein